MLKSLSRTLKTAFENEDGGTGASMTNKLNLFVGKPCARSAVCVCQNALIISLGTEPIVSTFFRGAHMRTHSATAWSLPTRQVAVVSAALGSHSSRHRGECTEALAHFNRRPD